MGPACADSAGQTAPGGQHRRVLAIAPDGKVLAFVDFQGQVHLHDVKTGDKLSVLKGDKPHAFSTTHAVAFAPSGKLLASADGKVIYLWDMPEGKRRATLESQSGNILHLDFSNDGKTLLSGGPQARATFWDVATGKPQSGPSLQYYTGEYVPGEPWIAQANFMTLDLLDAATGKLVSSVRFRDHSVGFKFSPDGKHFAVSMLNRRIALWERTGTAH